jgi:hypothetical protein
MAVTIYRSTDAGAPAFPASGAQNGAGYIMDVMKACLVDGYGSKPGAGWTLDYEDTTAGKRRIGISNGNGVIEFVTWGSYSLGLFIWDSITTPGVGRIRDDAFSAVMSDGVNGWKHEGAPAPGDESDEIAGLYCYGFRSGEESNIAWTVYADDKAAWLLSHYPEGHSNTEPGDSINSAKSNYYPQLFMGALKSDDLQRGGAGNFFLGYGGIGTSATSGNATSGNQGNMTYFFGLRTPVDTAPAVANSPQYEPAGFECNHYLRNPLSSARLLLPVLVSYEGADAPKPASLSSSYADYQFAVLPGVAQIGEHNSQTFFWVGYNENRGAPWSLQPATIGGITWMPWSIGAVNLQECGITDNADWW